MPARVNRRAIFTGEGPSGTPSRMVAVNRGHRSPASTSDRPRSRAAASTGGAAGSSAGIDHGSPRAAARSRATPAMQRASGRLAEMSRSKTTSACRSRASTSGTPGARQPGRQDQQPVRARRRRQLELVGAAEHAVRPFAPHLAAGDLESARKDRPHRRQRDQVADLEVPGAAHDLGLAVAGVHVDQADALGVRVVADVEDSGHHDVVEAAADLLDAFHDQAEARQTFGQLGRGGIERRVIA